MEYGSISLFRVVYFGFFVFLNWLIILLCTDCFFRGTSFTYPNTARLTKIIIQINERSAGAYKAGMVFQARGATLGFQGG